MAIQDREAVLLAEHAQETRIRRHSRRASEDDERDSEAPRQHSGSPGSHSAWVTALTRVGNRASGVPASLRRAERGQHREIRIPGRIHIDSGEQLRHRALRVGLDPAGTVGEAEMRNAGKQHRT